METIGYEYLRVKLTEKGHKIAKFRLETHMIEKGRDLVEHKDGREIRFLRSTRKKPESDWDQLVYGLGNEGVNIPLIISFLRDKGPEETTTFIKGNITGKYQRLIWFYYEELLREKLSIPDLKSGRYVELLPSKEYYSGTPRKVKRYKINDNRVGHSSLTPLIRRAEGDKTSEDIKNNAKMLIEKYSPELVEKSVHFLYAKETKKSNEIEREHPDKKREAKFIELLKRAHEVEAINESIIVELQNAIVDPRYAVSSYRDFQTYIGSTDLFGSEAIHYICPKGEDTKELMAEFEKLCKDILEDQSVDAVIAAAVISFLFVYIHPVEDGNGRIHRFLIHYVLSKKEVTPKGMIFPVSAVIANNLSRYDEVLENFSKKIVPLLDYKLDEQGEMTVLDEQTKHLYHGIDFTMVLKFLFWAIEETLDNDFKKELEYMKVFLKSKDEIRRVVDMPDRKLNNLINIIIRNDGKMSESKRNSMFSELLDAEIEKIESIIFANQSA